MPTYLLHIEFVDDDDNQRAFRERLRESMLLLNLRLGQVANDKPTPMYMTKDGRVIGLGLESERTPRFILKQIDAPGSEFDTRRGDEDRNEPSTSVFGFHDRVWLLEIGKSFACKGNNRAAKWLESQGVRFE